jgi:hypothetical protein
VAKKANALAQHVAVARYIRIACCGGHRNYLDHRASAILMLAA